jgi:hypothetical protein
VRKYWVSGGGFLNTSGEAGDVVPGTEIPIVTVFGEVSKVENQWVWEGIVRLAKDPQRLRNFMLSYIADIAAKGARQRPYFKMSQIQGLEWQFEEGGPDDNRPFKVLNDFDDDGNPLEGGPVSYEQPAALPEAAVGLLAACTEAIDDVTSPGLPQDVANTDLSGKAVLALQSRIDMQSYTYLDNYSLALQREAEIYASMVPEIYDTPRSVGLLDEDGTEDTGDINSQVFDFETGKLITTANMTTGDYKVRTKVAPAYTSRRDQLRAQKIELFGVAGADPEAQKVIMLEIMTLSDDGTDVSKLYARRELLQMGLIEPETDDDKEYMQDLADQEPPPDPNMVLAQAEQTKADAQMLGEQTDKQKAETDQFKADTDRYKAMIEAKKAGVVIQMDGVKAQGVVLDNQLKQKELSTREVTFDPKTGGFVGG